jgi:hypothetical protein
VIRTKFGAIGGDIIAEINEVWVVRGVEATLDGVGLRLGLGQTVDRNCIVLRKLEEGGRIR